MHKKIALLAGDGIGPEVMTQTQKVLDVIASQHNHFFEYLEGDIGGAAYLNTRSHCPEETLIICEKADAVLFGSVGGPLDQQHLPQWKNCETNSILKLRQHFNFNINVRPIQVYPELAKYCPLKPELAAQGFDFLIFRELTGGIYFGKHQHGMKHHKRQALDECVYEESQIEAIAHAAFNAAQARNKRLCSVDKANVLATSQLWREVVTETSKAYPEVELTHMLVDNCAMQMVLCPQQFDVLVTENMFGDILSDLGAALPGSLGLIPSASLNAQKKGLYEPSGGSAPDLAGKGLANPSAQILSAAMMLRHSFSMLKEAEQLESAVRKTIAQGIVTADLSRAKTSAKSTETFVQAVMANI